MWHWSRLNYYPVEFLVNELIPDTYLMNIS